MKVQGIFDGTLQVLEKALDLRSRRHSVIVSGIANADTPNYKDFDFMFEEEMAKFVETDQRPVLKITDPKHIHARDTGPLNIRNQAYESSEFIETGDGNTVDMDKIMSRLTENSLMYNAVAQVVSRKFSGLKNIIKGGDR